MDPYLSHIAEKLNQSRNDADASFMKKYMKGQFEYFGIRAPQRREVLKEFLSKHGLPPVARLGDITRESWNMPEREYQYFIMEVLGRMAKNGKMERIGLYEYMITNKSWWDTVDYIAANLVGTHFRLYPELIDSVNNRWMESGNIWLQRTCLLHQLKYKDKTDLKLLTGFINQLTGSKVFFINKAIGWILREYSKTDPLWVRDYVETNHSGLAPLSTREALKWIKRK